MNASNPINYCLVRRHVRRIRAKAEARGKDIGKPDMGDSQVGAELLLGNVFLAMLMLTLMLRTMLERQHYLT